MTIVVRLSLTLAAIAVAHWACELSLEAQELAGARDVKAAFKRRDSSSEEELRQQLQRVPEVGFGQIGAAYMNEFLRNGAQVQLRSRTTVASPPPDPLDCPERIWSRSRSVIHGWSAGLARFTIHQGMIQSRPSAPMTTNVIFQPSAT